MQGLDITEHKSTLGAHRVLAQQRASRKLLDCQSFGTASLSMMSFGVFWAQTESNCVDSCRAFVRSLQNPLQTRHRLRVELIAHRPSYLAVPSVETVPARICWRKLKGEFHAPLRIAVLGFLIAQKAELETTLAGMAIEEQKLGTQRKDIEIALQCIATAIAVLSGQSVPAK